MLEFNSLTGGYASKRLVNSRQTCMLSRKFLFPFWRLSWSSDSYESKIIFIQGRLASYLNNASKVPVRGWGSRRESSRGRFFSVVWWEQIGGALVPGWYWVVITWRKGMLSVTLECYRYISSRSNRTGQERRIAGSDADSRMEILLSILLSCLSYEAYMYNKREHELPCGNLVGSEIGIPSTEHSSALG